MREPETVAFLIERAMRKAGGAMAHELGVSLRVVEGDDGSYVCVSRATGRNQWSEFVTLDSMQSWWSRKDIERRQRMRRISELVAAHRKKRARKERMEAATCHVCNQLVGDMDKVRFDGKNFVHQSPCWDRRPKQCIGGRGQ